MEQDVNQPIAEADKSIEPFLKWAGGKRWLTNSGIRFVPLAYNRYVEPFLGGGAVFFNLSPSSFLISDLNRDLINCYEAIRCDWRKVLKLLEAHKKKHGSDYYYQVRELQGGDRYEAAARLIYLNRTCWNGLYRVNLKGKFNVPKGTKSTVIFPSDDFEFVAHCLKSDELRCQDFEETINSSKKGDFVFVDPPYTVAHNNNGFIKYNEKMFSWDDQIRLRNCVERAAQRGVKVSVTNADHYSIEELYKDLGSIEKVTRNSVISGKSVGRGLTSEILIRIGW